MPRLYLFADCVNDVAPGWRLWTSNLSDSNVLYSCMTVLVKSLSRNHYVIDLSMTSPLPIYYLPLLLSLLEPRVANFIECEGCSYVHSKCESVERYAVVLLGRPNSREYFLAR